MLKAEAAVGKELGVKLKKIGTNNVKRLIRLDRWIKDFDDRVYLIVYQRDDPLPSDQEPET